MQLRLSHVHDKEEVVYVDALFAEASHHGNFVNRASVLFDFGHDVPHRGAEEIKEEILRDSSLSTFVEQGI